LLLCTPHYPLLLCTPHRNRESPELWSCTNDKLHAVLSYKRSWPAVHLIPRVKAQEAEVRSVFECGRFRT
jgi:hypothetical protein